MSLLKNVPNQEDEDADDSNDSDFNLEGSVDLVERHSEGRLSHST